MTGQEKHNARADVLVAVLIAVLWFCLTLPSFWNTWPPDLSAMYFAGHFYNTGNLDGVYAAPTGFFGPDFPATWSDYMTALGASEEVVFPFVYPPIWAALVAPFTAWVPPYAFFNTILVFHLALIAASTFLTYRIARPALPLAVWVGVSCVLLLFSQISTSAIFHNQAQIFVAFLTILSVERLLAGRSFQAGAVLALAASLKLSPIFLCLIFILEKDWRALAATLIVGGALGLMSLGVAGFDLHTVFVARLAEISSQIAVMKVNYNLEALLAELSTLVGLIEAKTDVNGAILDYAIGEPLWVTILVWASLVAGAYAVIVRTQNLRQGKRVLLRLNGLLIVLTLCAPLGWTHHYLATLLLLPSLLVLQSALAAFLGMGVFAVSTSVWAFITLTDIAVPVHINVLVGVSAIILLLALFMLAPSRTPVVDQR